MNKNTQFLKQVYLLALVPILFIIIHSSAFAQTATQPAGSGTSDDPYLIETLQNLYWLSTTDSVWDAHFIQTDSIESSETSSWNEGKGWEPIGNDSVSFKGSYQGNNKIIGNLKINRPEEIYVGFFGYTHGAFISGLGLETVDINGYGHVGSLIGWNDSSTVDSCYATGKLYAEGSDFSVEYVGGLIGNNMNSTLTNSHSSIIVSIDGAYAGGLIGRNSNSIVEYCFNTNSVYGNNYWGNYGGIAAINMNGSQIKYCYNSGHIGSFQEGNYGGIAGVNESKITSCFNVGDVKGGSAVWHDGSISSAGGLVGLNNSSGVTYCYNKGNILSGYSSSVGGLVGLAFSVYLENCYSAGNIGTRSGSPSGGLIGGVMIALSVENSFWDIETSGKDNGFGDLWPFYSGSDSGCVTNDMKDVHTFLNAGWDFKKTWNIGNERNDGYPYLVWQFPDDPEPVITDMQNYKSSSLTIYPNPFNNTLKISNSESINKIKITNLTGQTVIEMKNQYTNHLTIPTGALSSGIYIVVMHHQNGDIITKKVIKK